VQATQCRDQIYNVGEGAKMKFIRILFYVPKLETRTPKKELWKTCEVCNQRWKYSHFERCRCGNTHLTEEEQKLKQENIGG